MECSEANVKKVKKCLVNIIDKEESILEYATVKLSVCSPQTEKVFRSFKKEGILCVIVNRNTSCLYLKLYELIEFIKVFEIELYTNISDGYTVRDNFFHIIEFPGFFLGMSFPIIENHNVSNRSSLIQKAIISTSKFISINTGDYIYSHKFDYDKEFSKKISKMKTYNKNWLKKSLNFNDKYKLSKINENEKKDSLGNLELLENKIKYKENTEPQNDINEENSKNNNNETDSIRKIKTTNINNNNINNLKNSMSDLYSNNSNNSNNSNSNDENDENDSITVTSKQNLIENPNYIQDGPSQISDSKDKNLKGILKNSTSFVFNNNDEKNVQNADNMKSQIVIESKEKNIFNNITVEESSDNKVYKIVQFHILKDKMKLVNKIFKKNFDRFIDSNKISFENIRQYKINTYDFLNDDDFSSEENDDQKAFVDYVPSNDMIGILENQDIQDERLLELMQQKKNLKEIKKKREDGIPIKTTSIYN